VCYVTCGDGLNGGKELDEGRCDDGNRNNSDGCNRTCHVECGFECTGGTASTRDTCASTCGDGVLAVDEECDDGNTENDDGCSSSCAVEDAWYCNNTACSASSCFFTCGDGRLGGNELDDGRCDDGNLHDNDGCSKTCHIECGWSCSGGSDLRKDICNTTCGDGKLAGSEQCDDGNLDPDDGTCSHLKGT
jgi:cysteine-rich repeat protein